MTLLVYYIPPFLSVRRTAGQIRVQIYFWLWQLPLRKVHICGGDPVIAAGEIRRDAEANIMQELQRAQPTAEYSQRQPPPRQRHQAPFQFKQQSQ